MSFWNDLFGGKKYAPNYSANKFDCSELQRKYSLALKQLNEAMNSGNQYLISVSQKNLSIAKAQLEQCLAQLPSNTANRPAQPIPMPPASPTGTAGYKKWQFKVKYLATGREPNMGNSPFGIGGLFHTGSALHQLEFNAGDVIDASMPFKGQVTFIRFKHIYFIPVSVLRPYGWSYSSSSKFDGSSDDFIDTGDAQGFMTN